MWHAIFCKNENIAESTVKQLSRAHLMAAPYQLTLAGMPFQCCVFPEEDQAMALDVLGLPKTLPSTKTDDPAYDLILDRPVVSLLPCSSAAAACEAVMKTFAAEWGVRMVATPAYGACLSVVKSPGVLRVHIYALPQVPGAQQPAVQVTQVGSVFGIPAAVNALAPSGLGVPLQTPEGYVVAEAFTGSALFILIDLLNASPDVVLEVLSRVLELYSEIWHPEAPQPKETDPRAAYIQACSLRVRTRRALVEYKLRETDSEMARVSKLLAEKSREHEHLFTELHSLQSRGASLITALNQEYDKLVSAPHVCEVRVEGGTIQIKTDDIYLNYEGKTYVMGRYQIILPIAGGACQILNETPKRMPDGSLVHHPHVHGPHGGVCLGELSESIAQLIGTREFGIAADMIIGFLHQFAPRDHYLAYLNLWEPLRRPRACSCEIKKKGAKP